MHDIATFLRGFPPFDEAEEQDVARLAEAVSIEFFAEGSLILDASRDAPADVAYVLRTGQVELLDQAGAVVDVLGPGDLIGLPSLLTDMPPGLSTRVAEDALVYRLPAEPLLRLRVREPLTGPRGLDAARLRRTRTRRLRDLWRRVTEHRLRRLRAPRRARLHRRHRPAARTAGRGVQQRRRAAVRARSRLSGHRILLSFPAQTVSQRSGRPQ